MISMKNRLPTEFLDALPIRVSDPGMKAIEPTFPTSTLRRAMIFTRPEAESTVTRSLASVTAYRTPVSGWKSAPCPVRLIAAVKLTRFFRWRALLTDDRFDSVANFQPLFFHQRQVIGVEPFFQGFRVTFALAQAVVPLGNMRPLVPEKL